MKNVAIPEYRQHFIDKVLYEYVDKFGIKSWPVDCVALLHRMVEYGRLGISVRLEEGLHEDADACTIYSRKSGTYQIVFNKKRFKYPFKRSSDRRTNFTVAHEIGHIALNHLSVARKHKTKEEILIEDLEADEFAGRLLMPKGLIFTCNYYSVDATAAYMNVSGTALRRRLVNLDRTDIVIKEKEKCCEVCGNKRFSMFSQFCSICGRNINLGLRGIRKRHFPQVIPLDRYKRAINCPLCGTDLKYNKGERCSCCSSYIFNFCSSYYDEQGECSYANLGNARFCEMCGRPTYYFEKGFMRPWQEV